MNFIENESEEKLRGGYYTPDHIARYLARWVQSFGPATILEPSCGDGQFIDALGAEAGNRLAQVTAVELVRAEAEKARERSSSEKRVQVKIINDDFLGWSLKRLAEGLTFDAVVGNPPFIRYQYLPGDSQTKAEQIFKAFHLPFTKHTNAWVPFVVASLGLLRPGGRLAMVLPAELIHVMHAQSLRSMLGHACKRLLIIDPEEIWFEDTLQGAVLLFAEKKSAPTEKSMGLAIHRVSGLSFLHHDPQTRFENSAYVNGKTIEGKWTRALLTHEQRTLVDSVANLPAVKRFSDIADVDVGLVTGANKFFLVPNSVVEEHGLRRWAHPMFGRSEHCPGVIYDERQHQANASRDLPTNFIWMKGPLTKLPAALRAYVKLGESQNLHKRFKCRVRSPWYEVPSVYTTEVGMLKRCHDAPRLIHNVMGAYTTDTAYRIRAKESAAKLVYCFINSLTALSAELEGRHYGGGVLELVPSEIEKLLIPIPESIRPALRRLDTAVRSQPMVDVLNLQDKEVLEGMGLGNNDRARLLEAWQSLRNRRHRVSEPGALDDLESERRSISASAIDTKGGTEQVAPRY